MGMLLVVPYCNVLVGAVVVDWGMMLRMASLRDAFAGGTSRGWGVQPGEHRTSGGMTLPPGRPSGQTRGHALPELLGVLLVGSVIEEGQGRHWKK